MRAAAARHQAEVNLFLATIAFAISFAVWDLIGGLAPILKQEYGLTATQTSAIVAMPVLAGSLGRLPVGLLIDWLGGRLVLSVLLAFGIIPCLALAVDHSYYALLFWGFWIGLAGTSFAAGVAFLAPWFPAERQGTALGLYGTGNAGQSVATFAGPLLAATIGLTAAFPTFGLASLVWGWVFATLARNAPRHARADTWHEGIEALRGSSLPWVLSLFYFVTFGGFVTFSLSLPTILTDLFGITPTDAISRTGGFVLLTTLYRPLGGWIADRTSGERVLRLVFLGLAVAASVLVAASISQEGGFSAAGDRPDLTTATLTSRSMLLFTLGALAAAVLLGLGNGAVVKLIPLHFPRATGTVTGLVGTAGGLGGFLPAIAIGVLRDVTGGYVVGFILLTIAALGCALLYWTVPGSTTATLAASSLPEDSTYRAIRGQLPTFDESGHAYKQDLPLHTRESSDQAHLDPRLAPPPERETR